MTSFMSSKLFVKIKSRPLYIFFFLIKSVFTMKTVLKCRTFNHSTIILYTLLRPLLHSSNSGLHAPCRGPLKTRLKANCSRRINFSVIFTIVFSVRTHMFRFYSVFIFQDSDRLYVSVPTGTRQPTEPRASRYWVCEQH